MTIRAEISNFHKGIQIIYLESFYDFMEVKNLSNNSIDFSFLFV